MIKNRLKFLVIPAILFIAIPLFGDTVYLDNGRSIDGLIEKEDERTIELNVGFGTVTFSKSQVKQIKRSTAEEKNKITKAWDKKKEELGSKEKEFETARNERSEEAYKNWTKEAREKKSTGEGESKDIQLVRDQGTKNVLVEALLNDKVKSILVVDTGASLVVLSRRIGDELGLDLTDTKKDVMELKFADGRSAMAKAVVLSSVNIQDIEVKNVMAAVMLEQLPDPRLRDGLLGMSFLNRFNLKMDMKDMKMTLEKLEK